MSRGRSYRAGVSRDVKKFVLLVLALVVSIVLGVTGWSESIIGWVGHLLLDQIGEIVNNAD